METSTKMPTTESGYSLDFPIGKGTYGLVWYTTILEGKYAERNVAIKIIDLA